MMAEAIIHGTTRTPTRLDVATWVTGTMEEMRGEGAIIHNAWKKMECEWFDDALCTFVFINIILNIN